MKTTRICQSCGAALADNGSGENYCASCFLKQGLLSSVGTQPPTPVVEGPPPVFGSYELLEEIGRGGMGVVYKARQHSLKRTVAIKLLVSGAYSSESLLRRFQIEAESAASLQHPGIVAIYEFGENEDQPFYAMELVEGRNLSEVSGGKPLEPRRAADYVRITAEAVHYAHSRGILHRDLKPSNVLIDQNDRPRITDFGLAKQMSAKSDVTAVGQMLGSPNYAPPEQAAGKDVGVTSDVYSLGGLLYNLLTGRPPFMAGTVQETLRLVYETDPIPPRTLNPDVPRDLDTICLKCLEKDPARRYATAQALADELNRFLKGEPILARPVSPAEQAWRWCRRHPALASLAATVVVALIASSVLLVRERAARARATQAELAQVQLRQQADAARKLETKNASRTALDLAGQLLEKGQTADALAYLVSAAQKDPGNGLIAPRLASVLTSHNFLIPEGSPFQCGSRVLAVHYATDGRSVYAGTEDGTLRVFDAASGELRREIRLGRKVKRNGWKFSDGSQAVFAVSFADKTVGVFEINTGRPVWPIIKLNDEPSPDSGARFSPDGRWLCAQGIHCFWIWDAATGQERFKRSFTTYHFGPEFTNDGTRFVFVSQDTVHGWSLPDFKPTFEPIPIERSFLPNTELDPHYSPDGRILAVSDYQEGVHLFDAATGSRLRPIIPFKGGFAGFLPDGRLFAPGEKSWDLLDVSTGKLTSLPAAPGFSGDRSTSADGRFIVTASEDGFPRLWETKTGRLAAEATLQQHDTFFAAPSPDGTQIVLGTGAGAILRLRVGRGAARPLILHGYLGFHLVPVPFFNAAGPARLLWFKDDRAAVLDVASGREVSGGYAYPLADPAELKKRSSVLHVQSGARFFVLQDWFGPRPTEIWSFADTGFRRVGILQGDVGTPPDGWGYYTLAFSPTGDLIAREKGTREIGIWDLRTGAQIGSGCSYNDELLTEAPWMEFSADGRRLAAGTMDGKVVVWDVATGKTVTVLQTQSETYCPLVHFSFDGTRLLTVNGRSEARLWNAATGDPCNGVMNGVANAGFSADGRWFFTATDSGLRIWDGKNGAPVSELSRSPGTLLFNHNGERAAISEGDLMRVCDTRTGQPLTESMHLTGLHLVDWSPDERYLHALSGDDRTINIFAIPPPLPTGDPIPPWLLQLASICGARKVNETGQCVDAPEVVALIGDVRRTLASLPDDAPYVEWGRWILADSPGRSIAPGFTLTPAEADRLAAGTEQSAAP
jgi:WD40 repeat protein/tRNA A-37 threonylcarbamoyl transferase component Bud32